MSATASAPQGAPPKAAREGLGGRVVAAALGLLDAPMAWLQRALGLGAMPYAFLAPNVLFFGVFVFLPIAVNLVYAVTGGVNIYPSQRPFVGADHFRALGDCVSFLDPATCREDHFWRGVRNTLVFTFFQMIAMVGSALVTALVLNRRIVARGFFRAVFFFPVLLSPVVVALIWKWILQRDGLLNAALVASGGEKILFLVEPTWAMAWAIFVSVWAHMGFYTLILLAGLQAIPADIYEAAEMDGARPLRVFRRLTLPLLWPNLVVVLVLVLIRGVQTFDEVFVLTGGGPGTATLMIVQYIYETAFANPVQNFGLAGAASILLGVLLFTLTMAQLALARGKSKEARA